MLPLHMPKGLDWLEGGRGGRGRKGEREEKGEREGKGRRGKEWKGKNGCGCGCEGSILVGLVVMSSW